jgi:hypothetical protein
MMASPLTPTNLKTSTTLEKSAPGRFHIPTIYLFIYLFWQYLALLYVDKKTQKGIYKLLKPKKFLAT